VITAIHGRELTDAQAHRWADLQKADPELASPYLSPWFTAAVAAVRNDVRVGLIEEGGRLAGFFPFQTAGDGEGRPVADGACDRQGVIAAPGVPWEASALLRGCGLRRWHFNHLVATQMQSHQTALYASPYIDVSAGDGGWRVIRKIEAQQRRLEREVGPVRCETRVREVAALHRLMRWKSEQAARRGWGDIFRQRWAVELLERLLAVDESDFAGLLSVLYAGDHMVAVHFGIRSHCLWHYWFPAYDRAFARHSPGLILLARIAESAASFGLRWIDLGRGCVPYKERLMSGAFTVAAGCVEAVP
jgi:CelD/BcsL family acetyltransferase involved in cellulose biosynthesis